MKEYLDVKLAINVRILGSETGCKGENIGFLKLELNVRILGSKTRFKTGFNVRLVLNVRILQGSLLVVLQASFTPGNQCSLGSQAQVIFSIHLANFS